MGPNAVVLKGYRKTKPSPIGAMEEKALLERLREQLSRVIQYWLRLTVFSIYAGKEDGPIAKAQIRVSIFGSGGFHGVG